MCANKETFMRSSARNLQLHPCALLFSVLSLVVLTVPARARTVTVECGEGTVSKTLKSLDPQSSNTIRVLGTCQDSITISDFADLTITGISAGGRNSVLESLNGAPVLWIVGSHVKIKNLTISGGVYGVMCREFSVCRFSGNTIQSATGNGVTLDSADATFAGDVLENNANSALNLTASRVRVTAVTVKNTTAGSWGPGNGIDIDSGSTVTVEQLNVQGNQGAGISLIGNSHLSNRPWLGPFSVSNNSNGGIWVTEQSSADLSGATVTNNGGGNGGAGVVIDGNANASFWGGGTFTGNQPMDVYCGANFALAAAPQLATIGVTNCPSTY
jgi:Right handed beta helix region